MRASRIITACAVLHNIAIDNRMPEQFDDHDPDAARPLEARAVRRRENRRRAQARAIELELEPLNIGMLGQEERGPRKRDYVAEAHFRQI